MTGEPCRCVGRRTRDKAWRPKQASPFHPAPSQLGSANRRRRTTQRTLPATPTQSTRPGSAPRRLQAGNCTASSGMIDSERSLNHSRIGPGRRTHPAERTHHRVVQSLSRTHGSSSGEETPRIARAVRTDSSRRVLQPLLIVRVAASSNKRRGGRHHSLAGAPGVRLSQMTGRKRSGARRRAPATSGIRARGAHIEEPCTY